jgi:hypothetical protein
MDEQSLAGLFSFSIREGWAMATRRVSFEVAHFATKIRPKAVIHRSLGHRPRNASRNESLWPKAIFMPTCSAELNMAFGQNSLGGFDFLGFHPGLR